MASVVGLVWIVVHPSVADAACWPPSLYVAVRAVDHRRLPPAVRPPHVPRLGRRSAGSCSAFGAATFQNSALSWSADHRAHHADTDGAGDPHAITRGAWFAHVGWLFRRREASADVTRLARPVGRAQHPAAAPLVRRRRHRRRPRAARWRSPSTWGDPWGGLLVAGFLRAAVMLQATFCVNSLAHLDRHAGATTPRSSARDSVLTALVTFGEGYHSFHHRFPFDYRNGARWWQYDPSKWLIWTLARLRLVHTVRTASRTSIARAELLAARRGPVVVVDLISVVATGPAPARAVRLSPSGAARRG